MKDYLIKIISPISGETTALDLSYSNNFERFVSSDPNSIIKTQFFGVMNVDIDDVTLIRWVLESLKFGVIKKEEK